MLVLKIGNKICYLQRPNIWRNYFKGQRAKYLKDFQLTLCSITEFMFDQKSQPQQNNHIITEIPVIVISNSRDQFTHS